MNKRKVLTLTIAGAGVAALLAESAFLLDYKDKYETANRRLIQYQNTEQTISASANEMLDSARDVEQIIEEYYLYDIDTQTVKNGLLTGMLWGLGDPYAAFYDEDDFEAMMIDSAGEYSGIGAVISQQEDGTVAVVKVYPESPSAEVGFRQMDVFYEIDGENVVGEDSTTIAAKLKGEAGTPVEIKIFRPDIDEYFSYSLIRRQIQIPSIVWKMLDDHIGLMKIESWDLATVNQFQSAMADLEEQGMTSLIIDVRDNPGGLVVSATEILDYFVPDGGEIVYTLNKKQEKESYIAKDQNDSDIPLVVLINGNSASASEIFAGGIKDYKAGTLVGEKTYGKGIVQQVIKISDTEAVKLTIAEYYLPNGECIHKKGIEPDVTVTLDKDAASDITISEKMDTQLQRGIQLLKEKD